MDIEIIMWNVFMVLFFALLAVAIILSIWYTGCLFAGLGTDTNEEGRPILEGKQSNPTEQTPVFGEAAWFLMAMSAILLLTFRAAWLNSSKVTMQFEWNSGESDAEERFRVRFVYDDSVYF
jgi:hypothetical protein